MVQNSELRMVGVDHHNKKVLRRQKKIEELGKI